MQTVITVRTDGTSVLHVASVLFDLWEDYNFYRREAETINRAAEPLRYKRSVRAAMITFLAYFDGVLNNWVAKLSPKTDLEDLGLGPRIGIIRDAVGDDRRVPRLDLDRVRTIRNSIIHPKPTDKDAELMDALLSGQFFHDADQFVNWLRIVGHALNVERHPDVPDVLKRLAEEFGFQSE